jgi:hypothetical protein
MMKDDLISWLIESGMVSKEELISAGYLADETWVKATQLHSLCCPNDHDTECGWYDEEIHKDVWERGAHKTWLNLALRLMDSLGESGLGRGIEILSLYPNALEIISEIKKEVEANKLCHSPSSDS